MKTKNDLIGICKTFAMKRDGNKFVYRYCSSSSPIFSFIVPTSNYGPITCRETALAVLYNYGKPLIKNPLIFAVQYANKRNTKSNIVNQLKKIHEFETCFFGEAKTKIEQIGTLEDFGNFILVEAPNDYYKAPQILSILLTLLKRVNYVGTTKSYSFVNKFLTHIMSLGVALEEVIPFKISNNSRDGFSSNWCASYEGIMNYICQSKNTYIKAFFVANQKNWSTRFVW